MNLAYRKVWQLRRGQVNPGTTSPKSRSFPACLLRRHSDVDADPQECEKAHRPGHGSLVLRILGLVIPLILCGPVSSVPSAVAAGKISVVGTNRGALEQAVRSAAAGAVIQLDAGTYEIDNPLVLDVPGMTLLGAGRDQTFIRPRNPWQAVIRVAAPNVTVEEFDIDGRVAGGSGLAAFAVLIDDGIEDFALRESRLAHAGASLLLGNSASGCTVEGNTIYDSGDDAIRLRGDRLDISGNVIRDYFDEAIDLGNGMDVRVVRNHVSRGRIGITLFDGNNVLLSGNVIEDQFLGGIDLSCIADCVISENVVRGRQRLSYAYGATGPTVVTKNMADVPSRLGASLKEFGSGEFTQNIVFGADIGIRVKSSPGADISSNQVCANAGPAIVNEDGSALGPNSDPPICAVPDSRTAGSSIDEQSRERSSELLSQLHRQESPAEGVESLPGSPASAPAPIEILGAEDGTFEIARKVAGQFAWKNPGVLSLRFDGNSLLSEVNENFFRLLEHQRHLAIGLVRSPFLIFHGQKTKPFPLWRLTRGEEEVAIVAWHRSGANVRVYILQDGRLGLTARFQMLLDWVPERLRYTRFGAYVTGVEGEVVVALLSLLLAMGAITAIVLLRRRGGSG